MKHTHHSSIRLQQRGFNNRIVELLLEFGEIKYVGDGVNMYYLTKDAYSYAIRSKYNRDIKKYIDKLSNKAVLVSYDKIVTVLNCTKKNKR